MALYHAPIEIHVRCDVRTCKYEGTRMVPHNFFTTLDKAFDKCPVCGYFTLKQYEPELERMAEALKDSADNDSLSQFLGRWRSRD